VNHRFKRATGERSDSTAAGTCRGLLVATCLLTLAACADRAEQGAERVATTEPAGPATGELLIAAPPTGWVEVSALNEDKLRIAQYTDPANLTPDQVDSVRFESQAGAPLPDPIDFVLGVREELRQNCEGFRDFPISAGYENGYPTAVRLLLCRAQGDPKRGLVRLVKAIQGQEHFYVVSRSRSSAPFEAGSEPMTEDEMAVWSSWIRAIRVCDTRDPDHPCPTPAGGN
jgi:hypothetical protein